MKSLIRKNLCFCLIVVMLFSISFIVSGEDQNNGSSKPAGTPKQKIIREEPMFIIGYGPDLMDNIPIAKILEEGEVIGYFEGTEWGDYKHLDIKDLKGKDYSFFISDSLDLMLLSEFEDKPEFQKKKIKVTWVRALIYIGEIGGDYDTVVAVKLEVLK